MSRLKLQIAYAHACTTWSNPGLVLLGIFVLVSLSTGTLATRTVLFLTVPFLGLYAYLFAYCMRMAEKLLSVGHGELVLAVAAQLSLEGFDGSKPVPERA